MNYLQNPSTIFTKSKKEIFQSNHQVTEIEKYHQPTSSNCECHSTVSHVSRLNGGKTWPQDLVQYYHFEGLIEVVVPIELMCNIKLVVKVNSC